MILFCFQTLSDPDLRKKYNEFGSRESQPKSGFMDPEEFFSQLFGGEKFVPIIGNISLGRDMKTALQENDTDEAGTKKVKSETDMAPNEKAKKDEKSKQEALEVRTIHKCSIVGYTNIIL
jgi:DnaJ-class molecular chaperone